MIEAQLLTLSNGKTVGLVNESDASAYLEVAAQTLRNWRSIGRGPRFVKQGRRVMYRLADLDRWVEQHLIDTE